MSSFAPLRPPTRTTRLRRTPLRTTRARNSVAIPASTPPVAAATGAASGMGSDRGSITRGSGARASTGRLRFSVGSSMSRAMLLPVAEVLLVHAVALDDLAAHPRHGAVHGVVRLEHPAHL